MDTAQWPQEILVKPLEEVIPNNTRSSSVVTASATTTCSNLISNNNNNINNNNNNSNSISKPPSTSLERKVRPQKDHAVNCPRCNSTNTKFCYYNNYSLTQPRYFCKTCRRYWTEGGSLRNIPVGGGSRKNKRSSSSSSSSSANSASKKLSSHDLVHQHHHNAQNPKMNYHHQGHDLNLGFAPTHHHQQQQQQQQHEFRSLSEFMQLPTIDNTPKSHIPNSGGADNANSASGTNGNNHHHHHHQQLSALELLNGLTSSRGLTPFMPMPVPDPNGVYSSGFPPMHDFKPSLNFSLVDGLGNGYGSLQQEVHQQATDEQQQQPNNSGRLLFPFEDLKQVSSTTSADHNNSNNNNNNNNNNNTNTNNSADNHDQNGEQGDSTPGYWSGMLGNGGSW